MKLAATFQEPPFIRGWKRLAQNNSATSVGLSTNAALGKFGMLPGIFRSSSGLCQLTTECRGQTEMSPRWLGPHSRNPVSQALAQRVGNGVVWLA